jgi:hypothetical protein
MRALSKSFAVLVCLIPTSIATAYAQQVLDPIVVISTFLAGNSESPGGGAGGQGRITRQPDPLRTLRENMCAARQEIYTALNCKAKDKNPPTDQSDVGTGDFSQGDLFKPPVVSLAATFYNARSSAGLNGARSQAFGQSVDACKGISICVAQVQVFFGANTIALPQTMWGDVNAAANEYMRWLGTSTPLANSPVGKLNNKFYGAQACEQLKQNGKDDGCEPQ